MDQTSVAQTNGSQPEHVPQLQWPSGAAFRKSLAGVIENPLADAKVVIEALRRSVSTLPTNTFVSEYRSGDVTALLSYIQSGLSKKSLIETTR